MKVITVKQPYASLIAEGYKKYEFRTWNSKYRGEILIHAGKSIDKKAMKKFEHLNLSYPQGCIIARANIVDCVYIDKAMKDMLNRKDPLIYSGVVLDNTWKGYRFRLNNVKKISPIEAKGQLGLWNYNYPQE